MDPPPPVSNLVSPILNRVSSTPAYPVQIHPSGIHPITTLAMRINELPVTGNVVRIRPHLYMFFCNFCKSGFRTIDAFLQHSESHFGNDQLISAQPNPQANPLPATVEIPLNQLPPLMPLSSQPTETVYITASPSHEADFIEEAFEITDLGYDFEGKYPTFEGAVKLPINAVESKLSIEIPTKKPRGRPKSEKKDKITCTLCYRKFVSPNKLKRHKTKIHAGILNQIIQTRLAYKCTYCDEKLPKSSNTMLDAERHMTTHFKRGVKHIFPKQGQNHEQKADQEPTAV